MKKRLITGILAVLLLVSLLPVGALASSFDPTTYITQVTGKFSGYTFVETAYGAGYAPKFSKLVLVNKNGNEMTTAMQTSAFHADKQMTQVCTGIPGTGKTYYFTIQSDFRIQTDFKQLTASNVKLEMEGINCWVESIETESKKDEAGTAFAAVTILVGAQIKAQPIHSLKIKNFTTPTVGSTLDTSVTVDNCKVVVSWEKYDPAAKKWSAANTSQKVTNTDWLQAQLTITPNNGYYFPGNEIDAVDTSGSEFRMLGHGNDQVRVQSEEYRMETLTGLSVNYTKMTLAEDECYYLTGGTISSLTTNSGKSYTFTLGQDTYVYSDEEFSRQLKREPKDGNTYYARVRVNTNGNTNVTLKDFYAQGNMKLTVNGYSVKYVKCDISESSFSGDYMYVYYEITKLAPKYPVIFSANGGSGTMPAVEVEDGTKYTLPECTFTPPAGKEFKAWLVDGRERAPGYELRVDEMITVLAVWKDATTTPTVPTSLSPMYVYYNDAEGRTVVLLKSTDSKREITVDLADLKDSVSGGLVHFMTIATPRSEDEGLVTFSSSNTGIYSRFSYQKLNTEYTDEVLILFTKTGTTTITAKLPNGAKETVKVTVVDSSVQEDTFTVKFDANGGEGAMRDVTFSGDNKYTLPDCTFTAPEGKMFDGWFYDGEKWMPGDKIGMQGDVNTVKALWVDLPMEHICDTEKVAKVKPTETEPGKEAYYVCAGCGNAYEDKDATKLIEDLESWGIIAPLGGEPEETEGPEGTEPVQTKPQKDPAQFSGGDNKEEPAGMPWWIVLLLALLMVGVGVLVAIILVKKQEEKAKPEAPAEEQ